MKQNNNVETGLCQSIVVKLFGNTDSAFANAQRVTLSFDNDWRFFEGDANGADQAFFNDASWRKLNLPHDWSMTDS